MEVRAELMIDSSKTAIWQVISNIEESPKNIEGIDKIELLNKPQEGLVGLKWKEYRTMFGREATEIMWITDAEQDRYYKTRAESHGSIYISTMKIEEEGDRCRLMMIFEGQAITFGARISFFVFSRMMRKSLESTMLKDLEDIKKVVESL